MKELFNQLVVIAVVLFVAWFVYGCALVASDFVPEETEEFPPCVPGDSCYEGE